MLNIDTAVLVTTHTQAGLLPEILSTDQEPLIPPGFEQIDWFHLALPFMFHVLCCVIALLVFLVQTGIAVCKYWYVQFCPHKGTVQM